MHRTNVVLMYLATEVVLLCGWTLRFERMRTSLMYWWGRFQNIPCCFTPLQIPQYNENNAFITDSEEADRAMPLT